MVGGKKWEGQWKNHGSMSVAECDVQQKFLCAVPCFSILQITKRPLDSGETST
jgi:hypothetical protein